MPGYVHGLLDRAVPLLGLKVEGDVARGFRLRPDRAGALDPIAPALEMYSPEARTRLRVHRPTVGEHAVWLHPGEPVFDALTSEIRSLFAEDALRGAVYVDPDAEAEYLFHLAAVSVLRGGDVMDHRLVGVSQDASGTIEECHVERLLLLRGARGVAPGAYAVGRDCMRLKGDAEAWLRGVWGATLAAGLRSRLEADLPARTDLVKRGFNKEDAELHRTRAALRKAISEAKRGTDELRLQFEAVKARQSALAAQRAQRLTEIAEEPGKVTLGPVRFLAHALVVPSADPEDVKRLDREAELMAMRLARIHEEAEGAVVTDVSKEHLARAAGLPDSPGYDIFSDHPARKRRCIEVKGRIGRGEVHLSENELRRGENLGDQYWLYAVFDCGTPKPELIRIQDPVGKRLGRARGGLTIKVSELLEMAEKD